MTKRLAALTLGLQVVLLWAAPAFAGVVVPHVPEPASAGLFAAGAAAVIYLRRRLRK
jgi:hypothetical protein